MSPQPDVYAWYRGEPDALELGTAALEELGAFHTGSTDIRQAVATQQKRWGTEPTGTLSPAEWDRLLEVPQTATSDASEEPSHATEPDDSAEPDESDS